MTMVPGMAPASLALALAALPPDRRALALAALAPAEATALLHHWPLWARPAQLAPAGDWAVWLILAGRGFGKTRAGVEWVRGEVEAGRARRVALVAETAADARDVMVEGESGLLRTASPAFRPLYEPSKRRLTWPNGAVATLYNATEPDQLRGPQHDAAWCDELAKWRAGEESWDNLWLGLRLGLRPRCVVTTTPRPIPLLKRIVADAATVLTRGSTRDNAANLSRRFLDHVMKRYAGTRLGRQEIEGEVLDDVPGALWTRAHVEAARTARLPALRRVVVAIDPAVTQGPEADETGIIVAGSGHDGRAYVLDDRSGRLSPDGWARRAVEAYHAFKADRIVAEVNNGGDLVARVIATVDPAAPVRAVRASRGKRTRAEPVAALYEQRKVGHARPLPALEDQMTSFTGEGDASPDRLDALVWALTDLMLGRTAEPRIRGLG